MTMIPILHTCGGVAFHVKTRPERGTPMIAADVLDQDVKDGDRIMCNSCGMPAFPRELEPDGGFA